MSLTYAGPIDGLILTTDARVTAEQATELKAIVHRQFPDIPVLIIGAGIQAQVVTQLPTPAAPNPIYGALLTEMPDVARILGESTP